MQSIDRRDFRFFLEHAGYATPPGRVACAGALARAAAEGADRGWRVEFEDDLDGCIGCDCGSDACACSAGEPHECLVATLYDCDGEPLGSLGSICEPDSDYRRVVSAELMLDALA